MYNTTACGRNECHGFREYYGYYFVLPFIFCDEAFEQHFPVLYDKFEVGNDMGMENIPHIYNILLVMDVLDIWIL